MGENQWMDKDSVAHRQDALRRAFWYLSDAEFKRHSETIREATRELSLEELTPDAVLCLCGFNVTKKD